MCVCIHAHTHSHKMFHSELDCTFTTCSFTCLSFDEFYREPVGFSIFFKERNETQTCLHLALSEYNTLQGCCNFSWLLPGTQIRYQHAWVLHLISSSQDSRIVKLTSPSRFNASYGLISRSLTFSEWLSHLIFRFCMFRPQQVAASQEHFRKGEGEILRLAQLSISRRWTRYFFPSLLVCWSQFSQKQSLFNILAS